MPPAAGGNLLKVGFADVNPGIPGVTPMIIDGVGAPGVVVEDPGTVEVAVEKESSKFKFILLYTLLVTRSEYPRDKPFLQTMVSYL